MKYEIWDNIYLSLIKDIRNYFLDADKEIWDKRNKIKVVHFKEKDITIKSFKVPHFVNKIAYTFFRDSKAKRSYENSMKILEFVPQPIGYSEFKKFGFIHDSYFLCEEYKYDFTIREVLTQKEFTDKKYILEQFALFSHALHEKGVEHLDYSPGNILIKKISFKSYEFKIVDVNRMTFKISTINERLENFAKLWAKDKDLIFIATAYAKLIGMNTEEAIVIALRASQKHKDRKNFKKRIKGKKVVD